MSHYQVMQCGWCLRTASPLRTGSPDSIPSTTLHHYRDWKELRPV